jgi:hypothetical protein
MKTVKKDKKSVLIKVSSLPPSVAVRQWVKQHVPKGVKILYTLDTDTASS